MLSILDYSPPPYTHRKGEMVGEFLLFEGLRQGNVYDKMQGNIALPKEEKGICKINHL
jgi:hypothetical protein